MNEAVQEFLAGKASKNQIIEKFDIDMNVFQLWLDTFKNKKPRPAKISHLQNKEKMKLVSSYLTGKLSLDELRFDYNVSEEQIEYWALLLSKEEKVYERERIISAEEKYDVLDRYFKGTYTVDQFQNDYGIGVNLFYRWVRQVQSGKPLTSSNIFRTASDELEAAYNIFLQTIKH
jgi:transposase-like protein